MVEHIADVVKEKLRVDPRENRRSMIKLAKEARRVKHVLSANQKVQFSVEYLINDMDFATMVDRTDFEQMATAAGFLQRLTLPIQEALAKAGMTVADVNSVEIVGGGVRVPMVQSAYVWDYLTLGLFP